MSESDAHAEPHAQRTAPSQETAMAYGVAVLPACRERHGGQDTFNAGAVRVKSKLRGGGDQRAYW